MAVPPPPFDGGKQALRAALRRRRANRVAALRATDAWTPALTQAAAQVLPHIAVGASIALYHALPDELDPTPLALALHQRGHALGLPYLIDRVTLRFHAWAPGEPLEPGPFGLSQPMSRRELAPDVVLTPLVGFDRAGGRLGQGAGHYDRAFVALPGATRIGYAWAVQEVVRIPHDPWDVPLHAIATETEWIVP
jgi:5-formyltetrahydrofolate cyclo-ligase